MRSIRFSPPDELSRWLRGSALAAGDIAKSSDRQPSGAAERAASRHCNGER